MRLSIQHQVRWPLLALALLTVAASCHLGPVSAQDTSGAAITLTAPESVVVAGTTVTAAVDTNRASADTAAIVWPSTFTLKNFVLANQAVITTGLTSLLLFLASMWSKFSQLKDWITRSVQFVVGTVMSYFIVGWGGTPDPAIAALVTGALSTIVGGAIFRAGRTQPGNQ